MRTASRCDGGNDRNRDGCGGQQKASLHSDHKVVATSSELKDFRESKLF